MLLVLPTTVTLFVLRSIQTSGWTLDSGKTRTRMLGYIVAVAAIGLISICLSGLGGISHIQRG